MPGWKSDVGRRLDALIVRTVPGVRKAVPPFSEARGRQVASQIKPPADESALV